MCKTLLQLIFEMKTSKKSLFSLLLLGSAYNFSKEASSCLIILFVHSFKVFYFVFIWLVKLLCQLLLTWTSWIIQEQICKWTQLRCGISSWTLRPYCCGSVRIYLFFEIKSNSHLSGCCKASTRQRWGFINQTALNRSSLVLTFVALSM